MAALAVNVLVAAGSVDGMAGAAAFIRHSQNPDIQLIFTQAFQVNSIDISTWPVSSQVGFIDLGVNNEGAVPNPQMTIDFVQKIYDAGHAICFIADEHGKEAWKDVLEKCNHSTAKLSIKPKNRVKYSSSCAILQKAFGETADSHTKELLEAGNEADKMNFNTSLGRIFNECTKSNIADSTRRLYVVKRMAAHTTADEKIEGWIEEYQEMQNNLSIILETGQDLGNGIWLYDVANHRHDASAVFAAAYKKSPIVVLKGATVFLDNKSQAGVSIATNNKNLNVLKIVQEAGIPAGGMAAKANLALKDQDAAIEAVRKAVQSLTV